MSLTGRTILITGASSGIGAAIARRFAIAGARLLLLGRDRERLAVQARALSPLVAVQAYDVDLADAEPLASRCERIARECPRLDALVHAAGLYDTGRFDDASEHALTTLLQVNVGAVFSVTRAFLPLLESAGGDIVVINSTIVARPARGVAQYAASKHALKGLTDGLREEVSGRGIRVTTLFPGRTATPMQANVHAAEGKTYRPERLLQPEDVAGLALFAVTLPRTAELVEATIRPALPP